MAELRPTTRPQQRILLATDLSARCDRALDRAVELAAEWGAELAALHVLEQTETFYAQRLDQRLPSWRRPAELASIVERQLREDVAPFRVPVSAIVRRGAPTEVVLEVAKEQDCDLIVTGLARDETLGRFGLGSTVHALIRRAQVPVLIVKKRPRGPYAHMVLATDFSTASRDALNAAAAHFPGRKISVLHAYEPPYSDLTAAGAPYEAEYRARMLAECAKFLETTALSEEAKRSAELLAERGEPGRLLHDYVLHRGADLVVLGASGRSALLNMLLGGGAATEIVAELPCDAFVVRSGVEP